jgi:hypothetical protein
LQRTGWSKHCVRAAHRRGIWSFAVACTLVSGGTACFSSSGSGNKTDAGDGHSDAGDAATSEPDGQALLPLEKDAGSDAGWTDPLEDSGVTLGVDTREAYCAGEGSPVEIRVPGSSSSDAGTDCTVGLASRIFQFGICSCTDVTLPGAFTLDALDSDQPNDSNSTGASVGTNGHFTSSGTLTIKGSLLIAGPDTLQLSSTGFRVDGNLRTNSNLTISGSNVSFGRDLWINGDILVAGAATAERDLYQSSGHSLSSSLTIGGTKHEQPVRVDPPCPCGDDEILDVAAIVQSGKAQNHNADVGLPPVATLGTGASLNLECGRFAFGPSKITGSGNTLVAHGRTAIFVDGDLQITGDFGVDVGTQGELDVFVSGNLVLSGSGTVGSVARPAALRFYVGGAQSIAIAGSMTFAANVYAPRATVTVGGSDDLYGSFFAHEFKVAGSHDLHYDRAILRSDGDEECTPPPTPPGCLGDLECGSAMFCEDSACTPVLELL